MIDILMATYNGKKFIEEQLQSIINQTYTDWRLIISDDCSTDGTLEILEKYKKRHSEKLIVHANSMPSGSAKNNFYKLLWNWKANSDYVMLSDQDDIWLSEKIEVTLNYMKMYERKYGANTPILIHTDLCVVDENLSELSPSLFFMQKMDPSRHALNQLLVQNIVTGCTMMVNKALLDKIIELPRNSVMHDMWLALIAAVFGKIGFIEHPTILYRQHQFNCEGAKDVRSFQYLLWRILSPKEIHQNLVAQYKQAKEFLDIYYEYLDKDVREMLTQYSSLEHASIYKKYKILSKYNLKKDGYIKFLGQLIR